MTLAIFDLDNTLIDRDTAFRNWATEFCMQQGHPDSVERLIELDGDGLTNKTEFATAVIHELKLSEDVASLIDEYRATYPRHYTLADATRNALIQLRKQGWRIGIATNGSPAQLDKMNNVGLLDLVDAYSISELDHCRKPDPKIFALVASRCGASLDKAWMIGDNPEVDIRAAHTLGLETIWVDRGRTWPHNDFKPTHTAHTIPNAVNQLLAYSSSKKPPSA